MAVIAALDAKTDLAGVTTGGVINEDVMQKIWDVSKIPLPLLDRVGRGRVTAAQYDWVVDKLATAASNKWVETANFSTTTASGVTDFADTATTPTARLRNHVQISVKAISVSEMGNAVSSVGGSGGLEYNLMQAQQELMRDIEYHAIGNYASVAGNGTSTAPVTAGYVAGCKDQTSPTRNLVDTAGTEGGYNTSTSVFDALTVGTARGITETQIRDLCQALYLGGCGGPGQALTAMCGPALKRTISTYMYTSSARIASLVKDVASSEMATAQGAVDIFITDFGTLELVPNRFDADLGTNQYVLRIFDPAYFEIVFLRGVNTTAGAKLGLVERRIVNAYWGTRFNPECMGVIADINPSTAMASS
jgi:hypothetical protein